MAPITQTVREIALEQPTSIRVFEHYGIDYCCGGRKPLAEACAASNVEVTAVVAALEVATKGSVPTTEDWLHASLEELSGHILTTHHTYVKSELPRLAVLSQKVVRRHGDTQAELTLIQTKLAQLGEELSQHLAKEEVILFPHVVRLERASLNGGAMPHGCFGAVANPIAMMTAEHDSANTLMTEIRDLSHHFTAPVGACPTYCAFYNGLKEFEQDLHRHIYLENNILFPRAIQLETGATGLDR